MTVFKCSVCRSLTQRVFHLVLSDATTKESLIGWDVALCEDCLKDWKNLTAVLVRQPQKDQP